MDAERLGRLIDRRKEDIDKIILTLDQHHVMDIACLLYTSGVCEEEFRGNMYEYLQSNHYDWDSIVKIIDRAGLREMFEKEEFTFLGPTNITIRKWFFWDKIGGVGETDKEYVIHGYKSIQRVPVEICRKIVLSHVIEGIVARDEDVYKRQVLFLPAVT